MDAAKLRELAKELDAANKRIAALEDGYALALNALEALSGCDCVYPDLKDPRSHGGDCAFRVCSITAEALNEILDVAAKGETHHHG